MKFHLEIECNNEAFQNDRLDPEIMKLLRLVAERIELEGTFAQQRFRIRDGNGNTCGFFLLDAEDGA